MGNGLQVTGNGYNGALSTLRWIADRRLAHSTSSGLAYQREADDLAYPAIRSSMGGQAKANFCHICLVLTAPYNPMTFSAHILVFFSSFWSVKSAILRSGRPDCLVPYISPMPRSFRSISASLNPSWYLTMACSL